MRVLAKHEKKIEILFIFKCKKNIQETKLAEILKQMKMKYMVENPSEFGL